MTMKISILDDYQNVIETLRCYQQLKPQLDKHEIEILHSHESNPKKLAEKLYDSEIIVLTRERTKIDNDLLALLPNLKLISQTGKISNHLDLIACTKHGVAVAEGIGSPIAPAELAWALLMNTVRKIPQAIDGMKQGHWQTNIGRTIHGKTIGIWGYGKIGQRMAEFAHVFGANVLVWGSESSRTKAVADGFQQANSKTEFFQQADIITLHLRLNAKTKDIVKESDLLNMKDNACLINTSRAELIEAGALVNVLNRDKPINVGLDVYEEEPIYNSNHELLNRENVICTPHLGYVEEDSYELYFAKAFANVLSFINNKPQNIANPEVC